MKFLKKNNFKSEMQSLRVLRKATSPVESTKAMIGRKKRDVHIHLY